MVFRFRKSSRRIEKRKIKKPKSKTSAFLCGEDGARTHDLLTASQAL